MTRAERLIWMCPAVFLAHDIEEIITVEPWLRAHGAELPRWAQRFAGVTTAQFSIGVVVLLLLFLGGTRHGLRTLRRGRRPLAFLVLAGALVLNAITHVAQAVYFRGYTPGVVTSVMLVIPYGYALFRFVLTATTHEGPFARPISDGPERRPRAGTPPLRQGED